MPNYVHLILVRADEDGLRGALARTRRRSTLVVVVRNSVARAGAGAKSGEGLLLAET